MIELLKRRIANAEGEDVLLRNLVQSFSVADIESACRRLTKELDCLNLKVIALYANNSVDWVIADIACQKEIISLPLPTFFSRDQIEHAINTCAADAVITDNPDLLKSFDLPIQKTIPLKSVSLYLCKLESNEDHDILANAFPRGTEKITFTSGSTGNPKGVCLSARQLQEQAEILAAVVAIKKPRHLCLLPLSTLLENIAGVYAPIIAEGEIIIPGLEEIGFEGSSSLNHQTFLALITEINPDSIILTPQLLQLLITAVEHYHWHVPDSLKFVAVGGARVSKIMLERAEKMNIPVFEGYGLSECASVVSLNTSREYLSGSCGMPLPNLNVTVEGGEIVVVGNPMLGYVNDQESWYPTSINTGDLGVIDNEGFIHITGRKKNLLISSYGRNISPEWLESELLACGLFNEVLVYGDARPYCIMLTVVAEKVLDDDIESMLQVFNQSVPDYARIKAWFRLPQPLAKYENLLTDNGKPKREAVAQQFNREIEALYKVEMLEAMR